MIDKSFIVEQMKRADDLNKFITVVANQEICDESEYIKRDISTEQYNKINIYSEIFGEHIVGEYKILERVQSGIWEFIFIEMGLYEAYKNGDIDDWHDKLFDYDESLETRYKILIDLKRDAEEL